MNESNDVLEFLERFLRTKDMTVEEASELQIVKEIKHEYEDGINRTIRREVYRG